MLLQILWHTALPQIVQIVRYPYRHRPGYLSSRHCHGRGCGCAACTLYCQPNTTFRNACPAGGGPVTRCTLSGQMSAYHDARIPACFRLFEPTRMLGDRTLYQEGSRHCLWRRCSLRRQGADIVYIGHLHAAACVSINLPSGSLHHVEVGFSRVIKVRLHMRT